MSQYYHLRLNQVLFEQEAKIRKDKIKELFQDDNRKL